MIWRSEPLSVYCPGAPPPGSGRPRDVLFRFAIEVNKVFFSARGSILINHFATATGFHHVWQDLLGNSPRIAF